MKTAEKTPTQRQRDLAELRDAIDKIDRVCSMQRLVAATFSRKRTESVLNMLEQLAKRNQTALRVAVFVAQKRVVDEYERLIKLHAILNDDKDKQAADAIEIFKSMDLFLNDAAAIHELHEFLKEHPNTNQQHGKKS